MRVFLVAGSPTGEPPAGLAPAPADRVIAVDCGAHHALSWGWPIHLLVGDLDSLSASESEALIASGVQVIVASTAKDETDLELALACALRDRPHEIVICAALGGRADHMLANLLLLVRPELAGMKVVISQGKAQVRLLRGDETSQEREGHLALAGVPGDLLSLLPIGGDAKGVTTRGLAYPLHNETLRFGQARGVSNMFNDRIAEIWLRSGLLLVIHTQADRQGLPVDDDLQPQGNDRLMTG